MPKKATLKTEDGITLIADFYDSENPTSFAVLSHMMPTNKESWREFSIKAAEQGIASIAYDSRGHGESEGGPAGYLEFADAEHRNKKLDLLAAIAFWESKGVDKDKIALVGASFGANLSLQVLSEDEELETAVLLSPGLNYRGIEAEEFTKRIKPNKRIMIISASDDAGNDKEVEIIEKLLPKDTRSNTIIFRSGGHGTNIFSEHPEIMEQIIKFIKKQ